MDYGSELSRITHDTGQPVRNPINPSLQALATDRARRYNADTFLRNGGRMTSLLSHISAFEYWRLVGTPGFVVSEPSRTTIAPPNFAVADFDWLTGIGALSRPLHGLTSVKHKRTNEPAVRHVAYQELPFGSIWSISPEQRITSPELTLVQIAPLLSFTELVCVICEFCGLFTINESLENPLHATHKRRENRRLLPARKRAHRSRESGQGDKICPRSLAFAHGNRGHPPVYPSPTTRRIFSFGRPAQS